MNWAVTIKMADSVKQYKNWVKMCGEFDHSIREGWTVGGHLWWASYFFGEVTPKYKYRFFRELYLI